MCQEKGRRHYEENTVAHDGYKELLKKKNRKREYTRNKYQSMSEKERQKLKECKKNRIHSASQKKLEQLIEKLME